MNNPNASSCLHFTKTMATLKLILKNGLRYSFAFEELTNDMINNFNNEFASDNYFFNPTKIVSGDSWGMAIPMVSFCDIPLTRAYSHAINYGKYIIGIDKPFLLKYYRHFFNPVIYVNCINVQKAMSFFSSERLKTMNRILKYLNEHSKEIDNTIYKENLSSKEILSSLPESLRNEHLQRIEESYYSFVLASFYKPIYGKDSKGIERNFYEEREWRMVLPSLDETPLEWVKTCTRSEFMKLRNKLNMSVSSYDDAYITIPSNCWDAISHIVVRYEYQRDSLIKFIMNSNKLFGVKVDKNDELKLKIISKISSFEKTVNDY